MNLVKQLSKLLKVRSVEDITATKRVGEHHGYRTSRRLHHASILTYLELGQGSMQPHVFPVAGFKMTVIWPNA